VFLRRFYRRTRLKLIFCCIFSLLLRHIIGCGNFALIACLVVDHLVLEDVVNLFGIHIFKALVIVGMGRKRKVVFYQHTVYRQVGGRLPDTPYPLLNAFMVLEHCMHSPVGKRKLNLIERCFFDVLLIIGQLCTVTAKCQRTTVGIHLQHGCHRAYVWVFKHQFGFGFGDFLCVCHAAIITQVNGFMIE